MNDDDRTVSADDDAEFEEFRRWAAEARSGPTDTDDDVTESADDSTMDELRRYAAELREGDAAVTATADPSGNNSSAIDGPVDGTPVEALSPLTPNASITPDQATPPAVDDRAAPSSRTDRISVGEVGPTDGDDRRAATVPLPDDLDAALDLAVPPTVQTSPESSPPVRRGGTPPTRLPTPAPPRKGEGWRPKERIVMPDQPAHRSTHHAGPWKWVSIALAVVLVLLVGGLVVSSLISDSGSDDEPTDEEQIDAPVDDTGTGGEG